MQNKKTLKINISQVKNTGIIYKIVQKLSAPATVMPLKTKGKGQNRRFLPK